MLKAGIFGATGYTGYELVQILQRHADIDIAFATSRSDAGKYLSEIYPQAPHLPLIDPSDVDWSGIDVVFLCLPHAAAASTAVIALKHNVRVIDLSADFRLRDADVYAQWYGDGHPAPHLMQDSVYGLTEFARDCLPGAKLVAVPGCYPTSILLALQPILAGQMRLSSPIIADSKSGISGAGKTPKQMTHFVESSTNFSPYKIGRTHRHLPEMEQVMGWWHHEPPSLIFSPHLLPVPRGILSTIYVPLVYEVSETAVRALYEKTYGDEHFINFLPAGQQATLAHATNSNMCAISLQLEGRTLILTSVIDNLLKGAAGQAVQCMNVVFGCDEREGLV
ncbi:MAG: N-acetyl-gamma-glutamyl-phosphate reductase [Chloroflexota bacterium]